LPKHGAITRLTAVTRGYRQLRDGAPPGTPRRRADTCFDMWVAGEHVRAVPTPVSPAPACCWPRLRTGRRRGVPPGMELVFIVAVGWTVAVAS
jgi:hypothetical protein